MAHFLRERGGDEVAEILDSGKAWVAVPTWLEFRLLLVRAHFKEEALEIYRSAAGTIDINYAVIEAAFEIRDASKHRLSMVDSMIAGAARANGMRLVHRDAHFSTIPAHLLQQKMLPPK